MPHYEAKMSSKGQITVPAEVRAQLNLKEGDRVDFYVDPTIKKVQIVARNTKLADLRGILGPFEGPLLSLEEIDQGIGDYLAEKDERIKREWNERREFEAWKQRRGRRGAA